MRRVALLMMAACAERPPAAVHIDPAGSGSIAIPSCKSTNEDANERLAAFCKKSERDCDFRFSDLAHPDAGLGDSEPDIDGDGVPELSWHWGTAPSATYLYLGGSSCARLLLATNGTGKFETLSTRHEGWPDVRFEDSSACQGPCRCRTDVRVFVFHDGAYREDTTRQEPGARTQCERSM